MVWIWVETGNGTGTDSFPKLRSHNTEIRIRIRNKRHGRWFVGVSSSGHIPIEADTGKG